MREKLRKDYKGIRQKTERLSRLLCIEDYGIQGMEDVSPPKWHLAHTSWFFEEFILKKETKSYKVFDKHFAYLFNSYYQGIGKPYPRPRRGLLSRPSVEKVYAYRHYIDECIETLIETKPEERFPLLGDLIQLGLEHELQHQELLLMDIKYNFSLHPDFPVYYPKNTVLEQTQKSPIKHIFQSYEGGLSSIGFSGQGFCFDNELPRHQKIVEPFSMAEQLVTNGEFLAFIEEGGYAEPAFWLSDGWDWVVNEQIRNPLYWYFLNGQWMEFTLSGLKNLQLDEPVCHVSYFEADAYARFAGLRLPTETEWEYAATKMEAADLQGNFLETEEYHPRPFCGKPQLGGDVWEWTASSYLPYPRYKPLPGILAEYNGKFMANQMVLRGGSCITPKDHWRVSYRNFYPPDKRWFFSGIRLAKDS